MGSRKRANLNWCLLFKRANANQNTTVDMTQRDKLTHFQYQSKFLYI